MRESSHTPISYYTPVIRQLMMNQVGELTVGSGFDLTQWLNHLIFVKIVLVRLIRTGDYTRTRTRTRRTRRTRIMSKMFTLFFVFVLCVCW